MASEYVVLIILTLIAVGLPVVLGIGSSLFKDWLRHREAMAGALNAQAAEKATQYAAQAERLEQRVQVLERIVTDRGLALGEEIEKLRLEAPLN